MLLPLRSDSGARCFPRRRTLGLLVSRQCVPTPPARPLGQVSVEPDSGAICFPRRRRWCQLLRQVSPLAGEVICLVIAVLVVPRREASLDIHFRGVGHDLLDLDVVHSDVFGCGPKPPPLSSRWMCRAGAEFLAGLPALASAISAVASVLNESMTIISSANETECSASSR